MKAEKKAFTLINHYYLVVYPYVGSDFMTGTETPTYKFKQAKNEAKYLCEHMIGVKFPYDPFDTNISNMRNKHMVYWSEVFTAIEQMKFEEFITMRGGEE